MSEEPLSCELLLAAYANGYFPMSKERDDPAIYWYYPEERGLIPLDSFHVPRSLAKFIRKHPFTITTNRVFPEVIRACAEVGTQSRKSTWINDAIIDVYCELAKRGFAHSIECWQDEKLVGGLYGVALGGAFFGESMFSRTSNASKTALVYLVELLQRSGYTLLDTQFVNEHLQQFGVIEVPRAQYLLMLLDALKVQPKDDF